MKKMKITQIIETEYENPRLNLTLELPLGPYGNYLAIDMTYTCQKCGGYGCRYGSETCDDRQVVEFKNMKKTIGEEQAKFLVEYFERIISNIKAG